MTFISPFTAIIAGGTGTGKTKWLINFIDKLDNFTEPKSILYCYSEINKDIMSLKSKGIEVYNGVPTKEEILQKPKNLLLILDDLVDEIDPKFLDVLYTRGSYHWNVSVILVTQNLFDKNIKTARINSHVLILLKNPQGLLQIRTLGQHLFPGKLQYFMEAYNDAVEKKNYGYLVINMHPNVEDNYRLSTNIFPDENTTLYLPI